jgi:hypothetical protein
VREEAAQTADELWVVEQHGAPAVALAQDGDVLVVGAEVEVLDIQ